MTADWEGFHQGRAAAGNVLVWPDEYVVRFANGWRKQRPEVQRVLDMHCGAGRHGVLLAGLGFDMVELDYSQTALGQTREAFARNGLTAQQFIRGKSQELPLAAASFQGLLAWRSLHVFPLDDIRRVVAEMNRVVQPGCPILFSTRSDRNIYADHVGTRGLPMPTDLTLEQIEEICADLEILNIELGEASMANRKLRDSYWIVHALATDV